MQILLTVAYDGTTYAGWQRQTNGIAVQQKLEEALSVLTAHPVVVRAASRTDAGVHALGQRAAFFSDALKIPLDKFPYVLNGYLPPDISVSAAEVVPDDFNPRYRACYKTYQYHYYNAPTPNPLLRRYSAFVPQTLDVGVMNQCAAYFIGSHDFRAFCATGGNGTDGIKSTIRRVYACEVSRQGSLITLTITGSGFLYNMVRIIAGTVLNAGLGRLASENVPEIIEARERARAGKTMPPEGLTLMQVSYEDYSAQPTNH